MALVTRLMTTCSSRTTSPSTGIRSAPGCMSSTSPCASAIVCNDSTQRRTRGPRPAGCLRRTTFPEVTRDTSRRSSTSRFRCAVCRSIVSACLTTHASVMLRRMMRSVANCTADRGLRSSCPSIARNSSLASIARRDSYWRARARNAPRTVARKVLRCTGRSTNETLPTAASRSSTGRRSSPGSELNTTIGRSDQAGWARSSSPSLATRAEVSSSSVINTAPMPAAISPASCSNVAQGSGSISARASSCAASAASRPIGA